MTKNQEHIHTPVDGRGIRTVFLNGKKVENAVYADTRKGVVRCVDIPLKMDRWGKRLISRTFRGRVDVFQKEAT